MRGVSPSLVISVLALFVALGGTGYAVSQLPAGSVGTKQLKNNAVNSSKVKDGSLLSKDFKSGQLPKGPTGPQGLPGIAGAAGSTGQQGATGPAGTVGPTGSTGATGAKGATGATGAQGSPATSAVMGSSGGPMASLTAYLGVGSGIAASESDIQFQTPNAVMTASNLRVSISAPPGSGQSRTFTLRVNGASTALTCTIVDPFQTCSSSASVLVIADLLSIQASTSGSANSARVAFGFSLGG